MRNIIYRARRRKFLVLVIVLVLAYFIMSQQSQWIKRIAEDKVTDFMGHQFEVRIGSISGGIFGDMILQDVSFISGKGDEEQIFGMERMEISYRVWMGIADKFGLMKGGPDRFEAIAAYFSRRNPFVQGFIKLTRTPGGMDMMGHISPVLFGEERKRGVKGSFRKRDDGRYDCDLLWDGRVNVTGELYPEERSIKLSFIPLSGKKGLVKIKGSIKEPHGVEVYSRFDKVNLFGSEIIGDMWIIYRDVGTPVFLCRLENMVVNKRPFWGFRAEGSFDRPRKELVLDDVSWGEAIHLSGDISTELPYNVGLKLLMTSLELEELAGMFGGSKEPVVGRLEGEINVTGPALTADVKGRLYIGEGVLGEMDFKSLFATLEGKLPVVRVVDSRVVKDGGHIIISGEMDFSKWSENKAFEGVMFDTDNKVAVWEHWQISKEDKSGVVEARKDNVTISTSMEDDYVRPELGSEDYLKKDLGVKYKVDDSNSIKFESKDEDSFVGMEHSIEF
ncbi:MAG: hypothetical protein P9L88_08305 [Candidatus Tantalella remota]|nr:hypothetical protein [Candidatus Tantalella remota]